MQCFLQIAQVEQCRAGKCVDQQIEIAPFLVRSMKDRTKNARIGSAKLAHHFANLAAFQFKHL